MGLFNNKRNRENDKYFVRENGDYYILRVLFSSNAIKDKIWQYGESATRKAQYVSSELYNELKRHEEAGDLQEGLLKKVLEDDSHTVSGGWIIKPVKQEEKYVLNEFGPIISIKEGKPPEVKTKSYGPDLNS